MRRLNSKGQVFTSEYVLVFFIIMSVGTAMTIYFRRAVQARIYDARGYMAKTISNELVNGVYQGNFTGDFFVEYEPYYAQTEATISRTESTASSLEAGFGTGIAVKNIDEKTNAQVKSETAPPGKAD